MLDGHIWKRYFRSYGGDIEGGYCTEGSRQWRDIARKEAGNGGILYRRKLAMDI